MAMGAFSPKVVERIDRRPVADITPTTAVRTARVVASAVAPAVVEVTATLGDQRHRGSGVVIREDGLILTSGQLLGGVTTAVVTWPSGRSSTARVLGHDPLTGLAALDADGSGFPTVTLDVTPPRPGERAITVAAWSGSAGPTLTQGVISATGAHADPDGGRLLGLIEIDNPVPSWADGGALVDDQGRVRGVSIWVADGRATGFAVPAEAVRRVAGDLDQRGRVDRGWLGVWGATVDAGETTPAGVLVGEVISDSPADEVGITAGDIVTTVDGDRVRSLADIQAALALTRPGDRVVVERSRAGRVTTVTVVLAPAPRGA
jgi:S1-C subfamily serine protease